MKLAGFINLIEKNFIRLTSLLRVLVLFFIAFTSVFAESNVLVIPLTASGSYYQNISMNALKFNDGIELFSDSIDINAKKGSSKGGVLIYRNDFISLSLYNLNSYRSVRAFDNQYPTSYQKTNGYLVQNVNILALNGGIYSFSQRFSLDYYLLGSKVSGQSHLYNYKTSPTFPQDKDLYFPDYQIKYSYKDISPKVGFSVNFEKIKIGFFVGPLAFETKGAIKGNAFFLKRDKKTQLKKYNLYSYLKERYSFHKDYQMLKNLPLSRTERKSATAFTAKFSFSLAKIFFPNIPAFDFTNIEMNYSKKSASYSQYSNAMFHQNFGVSFGFLYSQKGTKGTDLNILRSYEVGPIFRYAF